MGGSLKQDYSKKSVRDGKYEPQRGSSYDSPALWPIVLKGEREISNKVVNGECPREKRYEQQRELAEHGTESQSALHVLHCTASHGRNCD